MQHVFACLNHGRKMPVLKHRNPTWTFAPAATATPDAGGPSCEWAYHYVAKWCYSRTIPYLICDQYFVGGFVLYGHHCANTYYDSGQSISALWDVVKGVYRNHGLRHCAVGALAGGGAKWADAIIEGGRATPIGIMVVSGIGCVGGVMNYYWAR
jgi:hypothetical protein